MPARSIRRFFRAWTNRQRRDVPSPAQPLDPALPTALLVGFARWKNFMPQFLPGHNVVHVSHNPAIATSSLRTLLSYPSPHVYTWSYKASADLELVCRRQEIPLTYVEDGFIRSVGLGADRSMPLSLVFDDRAMHFDRQRPSRLEELLATYDFDADVELATQASALKELMLSRGLSKYNFEGGARRVSDLFDGARSRVLVLGQVEDDLSIRFGAERPMSGNELVMLAAQENPGAQIFYRPHPESFAFAKPHYSNPELVSDISTILGPEFQISDCLDSCDRVYTITSLAGFEAALRNKHVLTIGVPFYAGWGFTEDRIPVVRRTRRLTAEQVLAAAYLLYPRYRGLAGASNPAAVVDLVRRFAGEAP